MSDTVVVLSGGLDSAVLLYDAFRSSTRVYAISVNYGQRHKKELAYARGLTNGLNVEHRIVDLDGLAALLPSSQTSNYIDVPHGHYEAENMKATVVPNRNMILLSIAVGWGVSLKADRVAYAAHAGDHEIYHDCRPQYVEALADAISFCDEHPPKLNAPYLALTKADIVALGSVLDVPFAATWSCYEGGDIHCGKCGTCVERREAFQIAEVIDPTRYKD